MTTEFKACSNKFCSCLTNEDCIHWHPRPPVTHRLKIDPLYYCLIQSGVKTFEVRKNDRGFQIFDTLVLYVPGLEKPDYIKEYPPLKFSVSYILYGGEFGIDPDYVVMSIIPAV